MIWKGAVSKVNSTLLKKKKKVQRHKQAEAAYIIFTQGSNVKLVKGNYGTKPSWSAVTALTKELYLSSASLLALLI